MILYPALEVGNDSVQIDCKQKQVDNEQAVGAQSTLVTTPIHRQYDLIGEVYPL